jgi:DNA-binding IclR family transcriptional regulator
LVVSAKARRHQQCHGCACRIQSHYSGHLRRYDEILIVMHRHYFFGRFGMSTLQTLDRGLQALDLVSRTPAGMTVGELADKLGVHRAICYRIISTLEEHNLVVRADQGLVRLGAGAVVFSERFLAHLRSASLPILQRLANATRTTAFISIAEDEESVAIAVAEPEDAVLRVSYRLGSRHPLSLGAAGAAILAMRPATSQDSEAVQAARKDGVAFSHGEIERGATGVATGVIGLAPVHGIEACVGVVTISDLDPGSIAEMVMQAAAQLARQL